MATGSCRPGRTGIGAAALAGVDLCVPNVPLAMVDLGAPGEIDAMRSISNHCNADVLLGHLRPERSDVNGSSSPVNALTSASMETSSPSATMA